MNIEREIKNGFIFKHISFHCSRHTFACVGLEIGIPTEVIQAVLGHSNIRETQIYAKIQAQGVRDAMKAWDDLPSVGAEKGTRLRKVV